MLFVHAVCLHKYIFLFIGGLGADIIPSVSLGFGLSSGDNNEGLPYDCSRPASMDIMRMNDDQDNVEVVTTEQVQVPHGFNMPEIHGNKDTGLTKDDSREYDDLRYKSNILDNIAISILDTNANIDSILSKAMKSSDFPSEEIQGDCISFSFGLYMLLG